ncbi:hypothetical protein ACWCQ0_41560, partial [Streptomyces massasporeus]
TDRQAARGMLPHLRTKFTTITLVWADGGYSGHVRRIHRHPLRTVGSIILPSVTPTWPRAERSSRHSLTALTAPQTAGVQQVGERQPAMLWLTESGLPMEYASWTKVFERASARCAAAGLEVFATPKMLRHSMALRMLISLHNALDSTTPCTHSATTAAPTTSSVLIKPTPSTRSSAAPLLKQPEGRGMWNRERG